MRVQTKLILLLLVLSITFIAGKYFFQVFEDKRMSALFKGDNEEKSATFDNLIKLKGESLKTLAYDYTYWDEMVNFLRNNDKLWAQKNMDENVLKTYQADAIWVYKTDLSQAYSIRSQPTADLNELPLPKKNIKDIFAKERFCHFFVNTKAGLLEIRGATVQPTADVERITPAQGYFFTGRLWNKEYIGGILKFTGGEIIISSINQSGAPFQKTLKSNAAIFSREFLNWQGKPEAYIYVRIVSKELENYEIFSRKTGIIFIGFLISVFVFVTVFLITSVSAPLNIISQALKTEKPVDDPTLKKDSSEFGDIARLITNFFKQKEELVLEIAERKKAEEDLRVSKELLEYQNKSLVEVNKELDDFTYIVSHDLKEPLRSIDAYSKFIADDYQDKLKDEGKHYLERIRSNAERMKRLIEDLLEISRLKRKGSIIEEVESKELVEEAKMRLEYAITQKRAEITIKDKLPKIFCDRVRLTEVFLNLISNAVKFNDKPKPIIEISCSEEGNFYGFCVKDNGIGIKEEYFDKIFEIFQRLGKREDVEGTGAGLTIVKRIVQMHKGKIWVESKPGEGAAFYFTIPKEKSAVLGKKMLGEILLEQKLVKEEDIKKALEAQQKMGRVNQGGGNDADA